jgi:hypothetical protein
MPIRPHRVGVFFGLVISRKASILHHPHRVPSSRAGSLALLLRKPPSHLVLEIIYKRIYCSHLTLLQIVATERVGGFVTD